MRRRLDRWALPMGVAGLIIVALYHAWRRQQDKALPAAQPPPPLPPLDAWPALPRVSVLVAAWNEAAFIERHIESFLALRYPHKELVLCAGGEDETYGLARRFARPDVWVIRQLPDEGKQRALARCFARSAGEVIYLTDADCILEDAAFESLLGSVVGGGERAVTGRFAPVHEQRQDPFILQQWYVDTWGRERSPDYIEGLIGRNAAVTREALEEVHAFSKAARTGTDYVLAQQLRDAGIRIRYVHGSVVQTKYADSVSDYLRQQSRWLRNVLLHGAAFGNRRQAQQAAFQCMSGLAVVLWPLIFPILGWTALSLWLVVISHGVLSRLRYICFGEQARAQPRCPSLRLRAPLYFLLDQVMLSYTLVEWLLPSHRWKW